FLNPALELTVIVHVAPIATMNKIAVFPSPNQTIASGNQTMLGMDCRAVTKYPSVSSTHLKRAIRNPNVRPRTTAIRKPMSSRLSVTPVAASICPDIMPPTSVLSTVTPPGTLGMIRGGNMKVGKIPALDMTSHIAMITITNTTLLKMVVIAKFLLKHFFHFLFQLFHHTPFQIHNITVGGIPRASCLTGESPLHRT